MAQTMTLEYRNGRPYYYRNKRQHGRVVRHYVASGQMALLAADQDAQKRAEQVASRAVEEEKRLAFAAARTPLLDLTIQAETLTRAMLIGAGYHRQNRGPWRRRMK